MERRWIHLVGAAAAAILLAAGLAAHAGTLAQFRTVFGDIEIELFDQDKPITVQNFLRHVQSGRYRDVFVHRCDPTFVVQGGGFQVVDGGTPDWGIAPVETFGTITNEYSVGRTYSNVYGTIAMARVGGQTNSATSQWFINLTNSPFLDTVDGGFTVFGRMVRGTNVLAGFRTFRNYTGVEASNIIVLAAAGQYVFDQLPLLRPALVETNLVFVDISLLSVQVKPVAGSGMEISWNSVIGKTNRVEFTTNFPPAWHLLVRTNGLGTVMKVTDPGANATRRFYRVSVDY